MNPNLAMSPGLVETVALSLGAGWASGISLYTALFTLGLLGVSGTIVLPPGLELAAHPAVLIASGTMFFVEFFVDKVPGLDSAWDAVHTFIRIPAGAVLAASATGQVSEPVQIAAALAGGTLAAGTHATKAGARLLINTSPEPFSNIIVSLAEDFIVVGGVWTMLHYPWVSLGVVVGSLLLMLFFLPYLWGTVGRILGKLRGFLPRRGSVTP